MYHDLVRCSVGMSLPVSKYSVLLSEVDIAEDCEFIYVAPGCKNIVIGPGCKYVSIGENCSDVFIGAENSHVFIEKNNDAIHIDEHRVYGDGMFTVKEDVDHLTLKGEVVGESVVIAGHQTEL